MRLQVPQKILLRLPFTWQWKIKSQLKIFSAVLKELVLARAQFYESSMPQIVLSGSTKMFKLVDIKCVIKIMILRSQL